MDKNLISKKRNAMKKKKFGEKQETGAKKKGKRITKPHPFYYTLLLLTFFAFWFAMRYDAMRCDAITYVGQHFSNQMILMIQNLTENHRLSINIYRNWSQQYQTVKWHGIKWLCSFYKKINGHLNLASTVLECGSIN